MTRAETRQRAVEETIECIRRIESQRGVSRGTLREIRDALLALADQPDLFPESDFPAADQPGGNSIHTLSVDADRRFALYLDCSRTGAETPPHNHTTWAVVVGLAGEEENRFYRARPPVPTVSTGSSGERGPLELVDSVTVKPGAGVCMMPEDFHSIHVPAGQLNMNFHMYGRGLETLTERVQFDQATGTYRPFLPHPNLR